MLFNKVIETGLYLHWINCFSNTLYSCVIVCMNGFLNKPEKKGFWTLLLRIFVKDIDLYSLLLFSSYKRLFTALSVCCMCMRVACTLQSSAPTSAPPLLLSLCISSSVIYSSSLLQAPAWIDLLASLNWPGTSCSFTSTRSTILAAWYWSAASGSLVKVSAGLLWAVWHFLQRLLLFIFPVDLFSHFNLTHINNISGGRELWCSTKENFVLLTTRLSFWTGWWCVWLP